MSTKHNNKVFLRPFHEVDRSLPDYPLRCLPGRIAVMCHPINADATEGQVLLAAGDSQTVWVCEGCGRVRYRQVFKCEQCGCPIITEGHKSKGYATDDHMRPDMGVVLDSGVDKYKRGDVLVIVPDRGAFFDAPPEGWGSTGDRRELRIFGVASPWYDCVLGLLTADGFLPERGWSLVDREGVDTALEVAGSHWQRIGTVVSGECEGQRVAWTSWDTEYVFEGLFPRSYALVRGCGSLAGFHARTPQEAGYDPIV